MGLGTLYNKLLFKVRTVIVNQVNLRYRKRIRNKDFSILCSNCIGGIIYSKLGIKFMSPTVNLWIRQYDFIKLAQNPRFYLEQKLRFIDSEYSYPVAMLGDIRIHFNHSRSAEEAEEDWNRRKVRVNYNNLYVILYDRDNLCREQIESLRNVKCRRLIVLTETNNYADISYVFHMKRTKKNRIDAPVFLDQDYWGLRTFEKQFDFVSWLNGD